MKRFEGKNVLITGDSGGIGSAIVKRFLGEGAKVAGISNDTETEVGQSDNYRHYQADFANLDSIKNVFGEIEKSFDGVDILVNNAGISHFKDFVELLSTEIEATLNINLKSHFLLSQLVAKNMIENKVAGKIVFTASVKGLFGCAYQADYVASKSALISLTASMAASLGKYSINVNAVCPESIDTGFNPKLKDPEFLQKRLADIPLNRLGKPEDVAGPTIFLCSEDADYITGATLVIDGGRTCAIE